ncbi:nuclear transport factor 2 family protein [Pedobacter immunditicola]|uniref:nuclear transport factor 2 family protein n=1 Tax=Pedobacter immunditicola TaxID=3133440 RepID=UPI00309634F1
MDEEQELILLAKSWDEAMISNNVEEIAQYMTHDWVIVGSNGITTRAMFLESIRSGSVMHNKMDSDQMTIKIYGDTSIVISRGSSAGTYNGRSFDLYEWSTSVFLRKEGTWRCVSTMVTPALKN